MWSLIKTNFSPGGERRWFKWSIFRRIQISKLTGRGCHVEHWAGQAGIRKYWNQHGKLFSRKREFNFNKHGLCYGLYYSWFVWVDVTNHVRSDRNLMFTITICKYNMIVPITYNMFGFIQCRVNFFWVARPDGWYR